MSKYKAESVLESFKFAFRGLFISFRTQKNFQIQVLMALLIILFAYWVKLSTVEFAILMLTIALVLFAELINTVIEFIIDAYFGNKYSILAKMSKDICAGAVFLVVIFAVAIGALLFTAHIEKMFL